jgi:PAS domain S-box-containing protein
MSDDRRFSDPNERDLDPGLGDQLYRSLVLQSADCIIVHELDGRIRSANPCACRTYGYSHDELVTMNVRDLDPYYEERAEDGDFFRRMTPDEPVVFETIQRTRDGRKFPVEVRLSLVHVGRETLVQGVCRDISDRQRVMQRLQESESLFRSFVESVNDIVYALSPEGVFTYVSPNWVDFFGEPASAAVGRNFADFVHPEDVTACQQFLDRVLATGEKQSSVEYRVRHADGRWRRHVSNGSPLHDDDGRLTGYVGIARDVTERREAEDSLRRSEARYRSLAENFPNGALFIIDREWRYLAADGKALASAGLSSDMVVGRTIQEVFPELWDTLQHYTARAFAGEDVYYEVSFGGRYYANDAIPLHGAVGEPEQVIIVTRDITARRQADLALQESEERFRLLLNDVDVVAVQGYAPDGTTQYWNEGSRQLYGYSAEEALGRNLLDLIIPPELRDAIRAEMETMARTGEPVPPAELSLLRKDGRRVEVLSSHAMVRRPGHVQELFCIDVDLTEVNRSKREQADLQKQLLQAQKMESVGRLAGGIAHDFNNMLNVILGHAELLSEDTPEGSPVRAGLEEITRAGNRSADLTRQLLAFARRQTVAPRILDLNETVAAMLRMLERLIGEDIDLLWRPAARLDPIRIDPAQVDQILANLVVNARDAVGPGVGRVTIETAQVEIDQDYCRDHPGFRAGHHVMLAVSDDGRGMDAEQRARIFEPFYTTKSAGEGTGLGLATVYGIVKQNHGFINVYSEPGRGTTFRIYLPAQHGMRADEQSETPAALRASPAGETILMVEDEPAILELGQTMLAGLGYRVLTAATPEEAIATVAEHAGPVHLLLTDVVMPGMNGRELATRLRRHQPDLACLYMSGYTTNVIAHQGVLADGVHFIQKPFSRQELSHKVHEALAGRAE